MAQIFGDFNDDMPVRQEYLTLVFSPSSVPIKQRWRTNGVSADFVADYFAAFFPGSDEARSVPDTRAEVKSATSFIANELLENAMKFNDNALLHPISFTLQMHEDKLVFVATNSISPQAVGKFQALIEELLTSDPGELYIHRLEKNVSSENESGLGFLTIINDYSAKLGWKFETIQKHPETIVVSTMVQLAV